MSTGPRPPLIAQALLRLGLPRGMKRESVLGDFYEEYCERRRSETPARARTWYWREALSVFGRSTAERVGLGYRAPRPGGDGLLPTLGRVFTRDLPYAVRNLARSPGFTAIVLLSLALGIAPLTAISGFVNAIFFRPLPHVQEPDDLVAIFRGVSGPVSWPDLADASEQTDVFESVAGFSLHSQLNLTDGEVTRALHGSSVSWNYFDVLRVPLVLGRGFTAEEMSPGAEPVAVLSHSMWQRWLQGDPDVLGRTMRLNGADHTIIGVAPEGLLSPESPMEPAVYVPLGKEWTEQRGHMGLYGVGRLQEGANLEEARAQLGVLQERLRTSYPETWRPEPGRLGNFAVYGIRALRIRPGQQAQITVAVSLAAILGLLVLATACANLGNLLLARGTHRGDEIAVRLAMGADRRALVAMLLVESVLLGCIGGALGLLGAHWLTQALASGRIGPDFGLDITVDFRVLAFTAFVSVTTGILFGLVPALRASRPDLTTALKGERTTFARGGAWSLRNLLVVGQIAASLALLVSASVVLRSLQVAQNVDPGFEPERLVSVELDLEQGAYSEVQGRQFFEQLAERLASSPAVAGVAYAIDLPLDGTRWGASILPEGMSLGPEDEEIIVDENRVTASYFETMQMPIVRGRGFDATDVDGAAPVVLVNETLAERYWPDGALGQFVRLYGDDQAEIVGVVRDARYGQLNEDPVAHLWKPAAQSYSPRMHLVVQARSDPRNVIPAIRDLVREMDPMLPMLEPRLMSDVVSWSAGDQRIISILLAIVGAVALVLAVVGIYGVVSFVVEQRTHEVGVRVALGARRADVVRMVLLQGARLLAAGVAIGLLIAFGIAQLLAASLTGIDVFDPLAPGLGTIILAAATMLATLQPALRASRVDPMEALRAE